MPRASVSTPTVLIPSPRKNQSAPMKVGDSTITVPPGGTSSRAASAMPCEAPLVIMMLSGPTSRPSVVQAQSARKRRSGSGPETGPYWRASALWAAIRPAVASASSS